MKQPWCTTSMLGSIHYIDSKQRCFSSGEHDVGEVTGRWFSVRWKTRKRRMLNLTKKKICQGFCHFDKEKISTDCYTSGDPIISAWNNWMKPLKWGRLEKHKSAKAQMSVNAASLHVIIHGTWVTSIDLSSTVLQGMGIYEKVGREYC